MFDTGLIQSNLFTPSKEFVKRSFKVMEELVTHKLGLNDHSAEPVVERFKEAPPLE